MLKPAQIDLLFEKHNEVMTPIEVATAIRASDSFICDLINAGMLPCFRIGTHFRVLKRDVVSYLMSTVKEHPPDRDTPRI